MRSSSAAAAAIRIPSVEDERAFALDDLQMVRWNAMGVPRSELRLAHTLPTGQAFGWRPVPGDCLEWHGALGDAAVALRECPLTSEAEWRCAADREAEVAERLWDYFQLGTELAPLYEAWAQSGGRVPAVATALEGVRVLRQDPSECLVSFVCSSNNNIPRITQMLDKLKEVFHHELDLPPGEGDDDEETPGVTPGGVVKVLAFPSLAEIATLSEGQLRDLGFGYRAPYVIDTARAARDMDFDRLRRADGAAKKETLLRLRGVGPKVADCVALFCLDQTDAVPVDTHVWRITRRDYDDDGLLKKASATLTSKVYRKVQETFRSTFGSHAGWAHSLLFAAELPAFKDKLPQHLVDDMAAFRLEEKRLKAAAAAAAAQKAKKKKAGKEGEEKNKPHDADGPSSSSATRRKTPEPPKTPTTAAAAAAAAGEARGKKGNKKKRPPPSDADADLADAGAAVAAAEETTTPTTRTRTTATPTTPRTALRRSSRRKTTPPPRGSD